MSTRGQGEDGAAAAQQAPAPEAATEPRATSQRRVDRVGNQPRLSGASGALGTTAQDRLAQVRLSAEEAQAVISRALDLQLRSERRDIDGLSITDLTDIAAQVGVDPDSVQRALADIRLSSARTWEPSRTERVIGPHQVADATLLPVSVNEAREAVAAWMTGDEAMRVTGTRGETERWAKDGRLLVELRRGLAAGRADGTLRGLPSVSVATAPDPAGTMVRIEADTSSIRRTTLTIIGASIAGGIGIGVGNAAIIPDTAAIASDIGQFAVSFGAVAAVGTTTALAVASTWTNKVRRAVDQALDGISMRATRPELLPEPEQPTGWRRTVVRWLGGD